MKHSEADAVDWLPRGPVRVGITAGASTPNNKIGDVVARILATRGCRLRVIAGTPVRASRPARTRTSFRHATSPSATRCRSISIPRSTPGRSTSPSRSSACATAGRVAPLGAASLLYQNSEEHWPDDIGERPVVACFRASSSSNLATDGATIGEVFGEQLPQLERQRRPLLLTLTIGGNDLLSAFGNRPRGDLLDEDRRRHRRGVRFSRRHAARPVSERSTIVLDDGLRSVRRHREHSGRVRRRGRAAARHARPIERPHSRARRRDAERSARRRARALPRATAFRRPRPTAGTGSGRSIEPNARGASELRHLWLDALDARATRLERVCRTSLHRVTRSRATRPLVVQATLVSATGSTSKKSARRCSSARAAAARRRDDRRMRRRAGDRGRRRADRAGRPADARHLARRRRGVGDRTDLRRKRRGADRARRAARRRAIRSCRRTPRFATRSLDDRAAWSSRRRSTGRARRSSSTRTATRTGRSATPRSTTPRRRSRVDVLRTGSRVESIATPSGDASCLLRSPRAADDAGDRRRRADRDVAHALRARARHAHDRRRRARAIRDARSLSRRRRDSRRHAVGDRRGDHAGATRSPCSRRARLQVRAAGAATVCCARRSAISACSAARSAARQCASCCARKVSPTTSWREFTRRSGSISAARARPRLRCRFLPRSWRFAAGSVRDGVSRRRPRALSPSTQPRSARRRQSRSAEGANPLCGDRIRIQLRVDGRHDRRGALHGGRLRALHRVGVAADRARARNATQAATELDARWITGRSAAIRRRAASSARRFRSRRCVAP